METTLRRLRIDDHEALMRCWTESGLPIKPKGRDRREALARELALPNVAAFGLFEGTRLVGACLANYDGRRGWVNRLAIVPERRRGGLGARLIAEAERFLREQGAVVIAALIEEENTGSRACFARAGFQSLPSIGYWAKRDSEDS